MCVSLTSVVLVGLLGIEQLTILFGLLLLCQDVATIVQSVGHRNIVVGTSNSHLDACSVSVKAAVREIG